MKNLEFNNKICCYISFEKLHGNPSNRLPSGVSRNVLPYMACVKEYGKHMVIPQIGCCLRCKKWFVMAARCHNFKLFFYSKLKKQHSIMVLDIFEDCIHGWQCARGSPCDTWHKVHKSQFHTWDNSAFILGFVLMK